MPKRKIEDEIAKLDDMSMAELKGVWSVYCTTPPPVYNKRSLISKLAYRMQEVEYGGVKQSTINTLVEYAQGIRKPPKEQQHKPVTGTILIREYDGVEYRVTVLECGYEFEGHHYKSLSAVARAITGSNWNGNLFFGLRKRA